MNDKLQEAICAAIKRYEKKIEDLEDYREYADAFADGIAAGQIGMYKIYIEELESLQEDDSE